MAKNRDSAIMQEVKKALPKRACAIIKWWHQGYDNVWAVSAPTQFPTDEWVTAFIFQEYVLKSANRYSNAAMPWGVSEVQILSEEEFENLKVKDFDNLILFAEVSATTQNQIKEFGYDL